MKKYVSLIFFSILLCTPCVAQGWGSLVKKGKSIVKTVVKQQIDKKANESGEATKSTTQPQAQPQTQTQTKVTGNEPKKEQCSTAVGPNGITITVKNVTFDMIKVEAGTFSMGGTPEMQDPYDDEKPVHKVTITNNYYLGKTEVTQKLWTAVMGSNPSGDEGDNKPVENVSWDDCQAFIKKLNAATGKNFRLPTEAEWEFAARGGNKSQHYRFSGSNNMEEVAWCSTNSDYDIHDVAKKKPNELGLYDMSGNVKEWCQDWFGAYSAEAQTNPTGAKTGNTRVQRGGDKSSEAYGCVSSYRFRTEPNISSYDTGLRLALSEQEPKH